jgi:NitT/TauT family transport system permease protein
MTIGLWRVAVLAIFLGAWEIGVRLTNAVWVSQPSLILERLIEIAGGRLPFDIAITLSEIGLGLLIGLPVGVIAGLALGRSALLGSLLSPIIITLNSIPYIALAPVLIIWFGIGIAPKVALVAVVAFFLIFFSTFSGARTVDREWIEMLDLMGASRRERFQKVIAPASIAWILSGVKSALPYSLIAATVGEMMLARAGVGNYTTASAAQFDITGIYTGLVVLMVLGAIFSELARRVEGWMLRWRPSSA